MGAGISASPAQGSPASGTVENPKPEGAELRELRERVERLEREVAELRLAMRHPSPSPLPGPPMIHPALILASSADTATGVGIPLALAAGFVSFLSPCVLPLVPGYLSTVIGVTPNDLKEGVGMRRVLVPSLLFIASFSRSSSCSASSATVIGSTLNAHKQLLEQVGGAVIIALGVVFLASPFIDMLNREWHSETLLRLAGPRRAAGRRRGLRDRLDAVHEHHARRDPDAGRRSRTRPPTARCCWRSTRSGLAIPFLLIAVAFERMTNALAVVKRHFPVIIGIGGAVMIVLGADRDRRVHRAECGSEQALAGDGVGRFGGLSGSAN